MVRFGLQEFVDEIAIGTMNLDPVETGFVRHFGGFLVVADNARNLGRFQGSGDLIGLLAGRRVDGVARQFDSRRSTESSP